MHVPWLNLKGTSIHQDFLQILLQWNLRWLGSPNQSSVSSEPPLHFICFTNYLLTLISPLTVSLSVLKALPFYLCLCMGFPGGSDSKESACQCRRHRRFGFHPWVGKIPWRRAWQPTPVLLPGESHGQRSLASYSPGGCKDSNTTKQVTLSFSRPCIANHNFRTDSAFKNCQFNEWMDKMRLADSFYELS